MDLLTGNLKGIATYFDDILLSGVNASGHLENLCALLQCLQDKSSMLPGKVSNYPLSTWVILSKGDCKEIEE